MYRIIKCNDNEGDQHHTNVALRNMDVDEINVYYDECDCCENNSDKINASNDPRYERGTIVTYGDCASSLDSTTPLVGLCYLVSEVEDEEGYNWRMFTKDQWEDVKHLSDEEIFNRYPVAPFIR